LTTTPTLPYTLNVTHSPGVVFRVNINNAYTLVPTPPITPPPAPQTGIERSIVLPIIALLFGAALITGAEVYRRHNKKG